jgi:hypothetical protein
MRNDVLGNEQTMLSLPSTRGGVQARVPTRRDSNRRTAHGLAPAVKKAADTEIRIGPNLTRLCTTDNRQERDEVGELFSLAGSVQLS